MTFEYEGIVVRHFTENNKHFTLLLHKDTKGQYTNLSLLSPYYYCINTYFLDTYSHLRFAETRLYNSIDKDIKEYLQNGKAEYGYFIKNS